MSSNNNHSSTTWRPTDGVPTGGAAKGPSSLPAYVPTPQLQPHQQYNRGGAPNSAPQPVTAGHVGSYPTNSTNPWSGGGGAQSGGGHNSQAPTLAAIGEDGDQQQQQQQYPGKSQPPSFGSAAGGGGQQYNSNQQFAGRQNQNPPTMAHHQQHHNQGGQPQPQQQQPSLSYEQRMIQGMTPGTGVQAQQQPQQQYQQQQPYQQRPPLQQQAASAAVVTGAATFNPSVPPRSQQPPLMMPLGGGGGNNKPMAPSQQQAQPPLSPPTMPPPFDYLRGAGAPQPPYHHHAKNTFGTSASSQSAPAFWRVPTVQQSAAAQLKEPVLPPPADEKDQMKLIERLRIQMVVSSLSDTDFVAFTSALMMTHPKFTDFVEEKMLYKKNSIAQKRHQLGLLSVTPAGSSSSSIGGGHAHPQPEVEKTLKAPSSEEVVAFVSAQQLDPSALTISSEKAEKLIRGV